MSQIQPLSQTIDGVLKTYEEIKVPLNQRGFEWGREQASDLWDDLMDSIDEDKKVFLGTIVLKTQDGSNKSEVVDGQQRLTTISLLLIALREKEKKLKLKDAAKQLNDAYLASSSIMADKYHPKMKVSHIISDVYEQMIDLNWDGQFQTKIKSKQVKRQIKRVKPIYELFFKKIEENKFNTKEKIEGLLNAVRNKCYFVVIKIQDDLEALEIFERMNARGIELNAAELLKNHLFTHQLPEDEISADWDEIFKNSNNDLVRLLRYFYISIMGSVRKDELYKETKVLIKKMGPKVFILKLKVFSENYAAFANSERGELEEYIKSSFGSIKEHMLDQICDSIEALQLFKVTQHLPLVIACFSKIVDNKESNVEKQILDFSRILRALEDFHFINNVICKKANNEIERFYAEKCKEVELLKNINSKHIDAIISGLRERKEKYDTFADNFSEISYDQGEYYFKVIYYIFDRLNNYKRKGGDRINIYNTDIRVTKKNYNIDHLNPKNSRDSLYDISNDDDKEYINNIGNLIVISSHSNSRAGNMPISEKVGEIYKKYSLKLSTVQEFISAFKSSNWNTKEKIFKSIDKRATDLTELAYKKIWVIN